MNRFKFRAETSYDVCNFIYRIEHDKMEIHITFSAFPDVEVILVTDKTKEEVIKLMLEVDDSHVMIETLEPEELYTGQRDYGRGAR